MTPEAITISAVICVSATLVTIAVLYNSLHKCLALSQVPQRTDMDGVHHEMELMEGIDCKKYLRHYLLHFPYVEDAFPNGEPLSTI